MASVNCAPAIEQSAGQESRALITRLPSSCSIESSIARPSPQATCRPSVAEAVTIVPGADRRYAVWREARAMEDEARAVEKGVGVRPRAQAADQVVDLRAPGRRQSTAPSAFVSFGA